MGLRDWAQRMVIENMWQDISEDARAVLLEFQRFNNLSLMERHRKGYHHLVVMLRNVGLTVVDEIMTHPDMPNDLKEQIAGYLSFDAMLKERIFGRRP